MENYINYISVYNEKMDVRYIELKKGLNIILGQSKTGKSALLEIIDYCLCSKHCTIPSGVISSFAKYYSIVLTIGKEKYLIIRQTPFENGRMFFSIVPEDFNPTMLNEHKINEINFKPYSDVQREIELTLGLKVDNIETEANKKKKASLRNMVSYLFQHQNLIASKFALFYRFNDSYKRKDALEQFPIFSGILNQKYYSLLIEKNQLENRIKMLNKSKENAKKSEDLITRKLAPMFNDYYAMINQSVPKFNSGKELLLLCKKLPTIDDSTYYDNTAVLERIKELTKMQDELVSQERDINLILMNLNEIGESGKNYINSIDEIHSKASFKLLINSCDNHSNDTICPLCNQHVEINNGGLLDVINEIGEEKDKTNFDYEKFPEDIRKLTEKKNKIVKQIKYVIKQIKTIEKQSLAANNQKESIETLKYKIEAFVDLVNSKDLELIDDEEECYKNRLKIINEELKTYNYEEKMHNALKYINNKMNKIASNLDFEKEYKPIDLHFSIENGDYDFYLLKNNDKIHLEEMGSGANWISCHISLFIGLLSYFCKEKESCILKTLFLDQPSQVYFATEENPSDLIPVENIYCTIRDEIDSIYKETGVEPQVIIVDHASIKGFDEYQRAKWFDGKAFI